MSRIALLALLLSCAAWAVAADQKIALVVGNNAYSDAPLRNPVNDANAIAAKLRAAGFEVTLRTDVAQRELTRAISQFGQAMKPNAVALFYYAGHGMQVRGRNFLIPVDADIQSEAAARSEGVDVDLVLEQLGPARLSMVILDACRNNPFEGRFRSARGSGLAQIDAPKGTIVAYATAPGRVAADGEGANGVYTAELLKALEVPGLKVEDVFKRVRVNVTRVTSNQQVPWESSSLTGDFYFVPDDRPMIAQNEALKAVDEERKRRDEEAKLFRQEMEKLREEIRALRSVPAPQPAPVMVAKAEPKPEPRPEPRIEPKPEPKAAPPVAVAKVAPAPEPKPQPAQEPELLTPMIVAKADPRPVVAEPKMALPPPSRDPLEILRGQRGKLSYAKGMAILLAIDADSDLERLLQSEREIKRMPYNTAIAMGIGFRGGVAWGRSGKQNIPAFAEQQAIENCQRYASSCKAMLVNGDFREDAFLELAREFGSRDPTGPRRGFLNNLPPNWF